MGVPVIKRSLAQPLSVRDGNGPLMAATPVVSTGEVCPNVHEGLGLDWIQALMDRGDYPEALMRLERNDLGKSVDGAIAQAVCLLHLQRPKRALKRCDRALGLQPNHPQALLFKGVALHRLGEYRGAYTHYQQASPLTPSSRWSLSLLISLLKDWIRGMMTPNQ